MAYTDIDDPSAHFQTALYTGNGGTLNVVNDGNSDLQPDWLWFKSRSHTTDHGLQDTVRGNDKAIQSNSNLAEAGVGSSQITALNTDGFSLSSGGDVNTNARTYVCWQWKAGTAFSNDASSTSVGTIDSVGSANDTAGFSIVTYSGTGSNGTIKHGLSTTPNIIFWKRRDNNAGAVNWIVQSTLFGNQTKLVLNTTEAFSTGSAFSQTDNWTNTLIDLKNYEGQNASNGTYVAFCFAEKKGFSKFGIYEGNANNGDGSFVFTGFKPAWVMVKKSDATNNWVIQDTKRNPHNMMTEFLMANVSDAESTGLNFDFLSNGFKLRSNSGGSNSASDFAYLAFAGEPLVTSTGIPSTAR